MADKTYKNVVALQGDTGAQGPQGLNVKKALKVLKAIKAATGASDGPYSNVTITEIKE